MLFKFNFKLSGTNLIKSEQKKLHYSTLAWNCMYGDVYCMLHNIIYNFKFICI